MAERKLLLIEPDKKLASIVERFLEKAAFEVTIASDGLQGLQLAAKINPHLVMIEMNLDNQVEGGLSLGKSFRGDVALSAIPLVMMLPENFDDEKPHRMRAFERVFDGFLYKPFADTELKRVVENFTGFGESEDMRQKTLENLLDKNSDMGEDSDFQSLVKDLREKETDKTPRESKKKKSKSGKTPDSENGEPDEKDRIIKERDKRIESLLEQLSDMEMDHSFALEALESEKKELLEKLEALNDRILNLEDSFDKAKELTEKLLGVLQKSSDDKS